MVTTTSVACPACGTRRIGSFRYCRGCGYDYDTARRPPDAASAELAAPSSRAPQPGAEVAAEPAHDEPPAHEEPPAVAEPVPFMVFPLPAAEHPAPGSLTGALIARVRRVGPAAMERYERTPTIVRALFILSFLVLGAVSFVVFVFALVFTGTVDSISTLDRRGLVPRVVQLAVGAAAVVFFAVALSVVLSPG